MLKVKHSFVCYGKRAGVSSSVEIPDNLGVHRPERPNFVLETICFFVVFLFIAHYLGMIAKYLAIIAGRLH